MEGKDEFTGKKDRLCEGESRGGSLRSTAGRELVWTGHPQERNRSSAALVQSRNGVLTLALLRSQERPRRDGPFLAVFRVFSVFSVFRVLDWFRRPDIHQWRSSTVLNGRKMVAIIP